VPLRNRKTRGIFFDFHDHKPAYKTREILQIPEHAPHLLSWQTELIKWLSAYYFCPLSKVLKLFLPTGIVKKKNLQPWSAGEFQNTELKVQHKLNEEQKHALQVLLESPKKIFLLHGITASGKTEIYLHFADEILKQGKQVLMLIPEISLTPQTLERFKAHFHQKIAVIHSQLSSKEKEKEWLSIYKGEARIIIGSRSAIFAPFENLGCIILDEEHDFSYKQDQSPRYQTIDVAVQIAKLINIKILMGSATPSLESYYQAKLGHYELLEITKRATLSTLPKTTIIDLREEIKKKNFSIFSELLQQKLLEKLQKKEQTILFLNRRGAASAVICRSCGYVVQCPNCDLPMTYHSKISVEDSIYPAERLICHHCGKFEHVPKTCPKCESHYIRYIGLGTQRVEDDLKKLLPQARILRVDRDTVQKKDHFKNIYEAFKNHQADILVGTQMIAFGLDLPKVSLVGVILPDLSLTIPNFRSSEKTFQLITQVAGRAGRSKNEGEVVIQSYLPGHYAIQKASKHDYHGFYETEIRLREKLKYTPFSKLIKLTISDKNSKICHDLALETFEKLQKMKTENDEITLYPALIAKLRNLYRWHILICGQNPAELLRAEKSILDDEKVKVDVDPLSTI